MYAVIETGGKQYKVSEGDVIRVEKLNVEEGGSVSFDKVIFIGGDETKIGTPYIEGTKVEGSVIKNGKAKKIIVYHYKSKTGYHKKNGHRQPFTEVRIEKIV